MRRGRKGYEFPSEVKQAAREKAHYRCENCGELSDRLEVHHCFVSVGQAKQRKIPARNIITIYNAMCLCPKCHRQKNKQQMTWDEDKKRCHQNLLDHWKVFASRSRANSRIDELKRNLR